MQYAWDEAKELIKTGNVFLTFSTTWCPDCKMMKLMLEPVLKELKDQGHDFKEVEVDAEKAELFRGVSEWQVLKVPSFYVVKDGMRQHIGYEFVPTDLIKEKIISICK